MLTWVWLVGRRAERELPAEMPRAFDHDPAPAGHTRRGREGARVVVSLAGLIAAALVIIAAAVYAGSVRQDSIQRASEERIVASSLRALLRATAANARDYAWWDDAVRHLVLGFDPAWAEANIGPLHASLGYDAAFAVAGDGRTIYGLLGGERTDVEAASVLGPGLARLAARAGRSGEGGEPLPSAAILEGPGGLFAAAVSPIVPQDPAGLELPAGPHATLVVGKRLDGGYLAGLQEDFGLDTLRLVPAGDRSGASAAAAPLHGPDGEILRHVAWEPRRPGRRQLAWLIPALLGSLGVLALFTRLVLRDVRRSTAAIRASEARFRDIAEAGSDWIWETDADLRLTYVSDHFARATGLRPGDVAGLGLHEVLRPPAEPEQRRRHQAALGAARPFRDLLCRLRSGDQGLRTLRVAGKPVVGPDGALRGYRGTATDITAEVEALDRVRFLAEHDALTGLPNRLLLRERLAEAAARCRRDGTEAVVLCVDLDRFKEVNDTLGHAAGDRLLVGCAERLRACARDGDVVARLGGDEFALLRAGAGGPADVAALCERVIDALREPFHLDGHEVVVGASVGVAAAPGDGEDAARLLQNADIALYRAKAEGRGRFRRFEAGMDEELRQRKALEAALRGALPAGELEVHYQPQVDARSLRLVGVEALVRWRHPERGVVSPAEFVAVAEETGLILSIGEWVLRTACRDAVAWPSLTVSVNVSPVQVRYRDLPGLVSRALADARLPPSRLELEITEGVLLQNAAEALSVLEQVKAGGVRIAMDDFGTGYSSLGYLQRFPFDKIKIDRSFVAGLDAGVENAAIVRAVVSLARTLGACTCAEGVETQGQLARLRAEGCDQLQGYLFGRPAPAAAIGRLLEAQDAAGPPATGQRRAAAAAA
jgi:diguanylate cyclase (GGDEF)-like protein/PAS domain S-box-containing protein